VGYRDHRSKKRGCAPQPHFYPKPRPRPCPPPAQTHTHEFLGSTQLAGDILHNHRFVGVSSEAIQRGKSHTHALLVNSDFFLSHYHEVAAESGPAIPVGGGRHVHFVCGETTFNAGHDHEFIFAMLIEDPISDDKHRPRHEDKDYEDDYYYDDYRDEWDDRDDKKDRGDREEDGDRDRVNTFIEVE
jgi:hypothetical protein